MNRLPTLGTKTPDEIQEHQDRLLRQLIDSIRSSDEPKFLDLVDQVKNLDAFSKVYDSTPLISACVQPSEKFVHLLLQRNVDVDVARRGTGLTPLMAAAWHFYPVTGARIMRMLLDKGANVNAKDTWGGSPLMYASQWWGRKKVKLLLAAGADPNMTDDSGRTALMWAAQYKRRENMEILLKAGADPTIYDKIGLTALDYTPKRCWRIRQMLTIHRWMYASVYGTLRTNS